MAKAVVRKPKKKQNPLKAAKIDVVDYKDTALLRKFISDRGKIRARRVTGVSVQEQRAIARAVKNAREIATLDDAKAIRDSLQSKAVVVSAKAGESGRLFGAVTTAEIADAVKKSGAPQIDKRKVEIGQPIKALGEYQVSVRLHAG